MIKKRSDYEKRVDYAHENFNHRGLGSPITTGVESDIFFVFKNGERSD